MIPWSPRTPTPPTTCWSRPATWPKARRCGRVLLFAMGRASLAAGNLARAIENFQLYLKEYPSGADRFAVRLPARRSPAEDQSSPCSPG